MMIILVIKNDYQLNSNKTAIYQIVKLICIHKQTSTLHASFSKYLQHLDAIIQYFIAYKIRVGILYSVRSFYNSTNGYIK